MTSAKPDEVNARERTRQRLKARLEESGLTNRAFGERLGHGDQWVWGLLKGRFALSLDELDAAAKALKWSPCDLVKPEDDEAQYLRPTESRVIRALRKLPTAIQDHLVVLLEYLIGAAPEEIALLQRVRRLAPDERRRIEHFVDVTLSAQGSAPATADPDGPDQTAAPQSKTAKQSRRRAR
jgi:transcriptional regulator with XRE-family HTH domain